MTKANLPHEKKSRPTAWFWTRPAHSSCPRRRGILCLERAGAARHTVVRAACRPAGLNDLSSLIYYLPISASWLAELPRLSFRTFPAVAYPSPGLACTVGDLRASRPSVAPACYLARLTDPVPILVSPSAINLLVYYSWPPSSPVHFITIMSG